MQHLISYWLVVMKENLDTNWNMNFPTTLSEKHESLVELDIAKKTSSRIDWLPPMCLLKFKARQKLKDFDYTMKIKEVMFCRHKNIQSTAHTLGVPKSTLH